MSNGVRPGAVNRRRPREAEEDRLQQRGTLANALRPGPMNRTAIGRRAEIAVGLILVGAAVLGWPARSEGEVLIRISEGHGLTAIDILGVVPLVVGISWCEWILWRSRRLLGARSRRIPD
jgi:hypothetical protein